MHTPFFAVTPLKAGDIRWSRASAAHVLPGWRQIRLSRVADACVWSTVPAAWVCDVLNERGEIIDQGVFDTADMATDEEYAQHCLVS